MAHCHADGGRHALSARHVPVQGGKVAVVTGANSGLGWHVAETLAAKGATVVMGCRDAARAAQAANAIRRFHPAARVEADPLDLADLASIQSPGRQIVRHNGRGALNRASPASPILMLITLTKTKACRKPDSTAHCYQSGNNLSSKSAFTLNDPVTKI
nr:SDR family NAD(P)-dependent oxidoreductase [Burkholderia diffusa]